MRKTFAHSMLAAAIYALSTSFAVSAEPVPARLRLLAGGDWLAIEPPPASGETLILAPLQPVVSNAPWVIDPASGSLASVPVRLSFTPLVGNAATREAQLCSADISPWLGLTVGPGDCPSPARAAAQPRVLAGRLGLSTQQWEIGLSAGQMRSEGGEAATPWSSHWNLTAGTPTRAGNWQLLPQKTDAISLSANWQLAGQWQIGASSGFGRTEFLPGAGVSGSSSETQLGFGLGYGSLSGNLIGRVVRSAVPGLDNSYGSLDLGVYWHLPWSGELSFGARNLMARPLEPMPPGGNSATEQAAPRTAYVHYRQDL